MVVGGKYSRNHSRHEWEENKDKRTSADSQPTLMQTRAMPKLAAPPPRVLFQALSQEPSLSHFIRSQHVYPETDPVRVVLKMVLKQDLQ